MKAAEVLKDLEWARPVSRNIKSCPCCYAWQSFGHDPGCRLAAAVKATASSEVEGLRAERDALRAENEWNKHLVQLLRADLARFLNAGDVTLCEGCDAPIDYDEEASTVSDVRGCWGFVADDTKAPCYRYRTEKGADRSWPICAALAQHDTPAPETSHE